MKVDVLLGLQWGDEGKGKIIDVLAPKYDIVARFQGGPNAGHSLELGDIKFVTHQIPSGIFHDRIINIVGNGVVFDPVKFRNEILGVDLPEKRIPGLVDYLSLEEIKNRLIISDEAHFILPSHRWLDEVYEAAKGGSKIGTTLCGIAPAYTDKAARVGIRIGEIFDEDFALRFERLLSSHRDVIAIHDDLYFERNDTWEEQINDFFEAVEFLKEFTVLDTVTYINEALKNGKSVLAEGAQGTSLDINFGDYPFVTSSSTVSAGACIGLGVPPQAIGEVYGLVKAYTTRVGSGPFPTEQINEIGETLRQKGREYGATTGRPRRCGWLDMVQLKRAIMLNGVTQLILSKADVLNDFEEIKVCIAYGEELEYVSFDGLEYLRSEYLSYTKFIEDATGVPIYLISTGPERKQILVNRFKE